MRRGALGGADGAACVDRDHRVGAPRGGERLAHRARRQQPSVAHPALGVHQQQIDVASEAHVLKSVVEHHRVERAHPLFDKLDAVDAPARDRDRAGERFRHHHRLVAGFVRTSEQPLVVGDQDRALRARRAAPSAAHDRDLKPSHAQARGEEQRERGLGIAAQREIADAHDQRSRAPSHPAPPERARRQRNPISAGRGHQRGP